MRHNPARVSPILILFALLLASASCTHKSTPRHSSTSSPFSPVPQSSVPPTPLPLSPTPLPPLSQSTIINPQSTITPEASFTRSPSPLSPTPLSPAPQSSSNDLKSTIYNLSARFDFYLRSLSITETITYTNSTEQTLTDLLLVVPANRWPGSFQLNEIRWASGDQIQDFYLQLHRLDVQFPQPLPPGEKTTLILAYDLVLPTIPPPSDAAPQPFGYTQAQANLVDWYAYVPPFRNDWLVHDPYYWGEYQVFDEGDFRVDLTMQDAPDGLVVAASAPPFETVTGEGVTYHYRLRSARTFALSISPSYQVFSQTVDLGGSSVRVYSYAFTLDAEAGKAALADTARAVELYSDLFGAYPHTALSVVEADFLDGMEFDGLYFLSKGFYNLYDGTPSGYLTAIAVHETAHQWWYGLVGNDQAMEPWLDEGMCAFSERLYYEHYAPSALTSWWQPYRVNFYDPRGPVDGSIYEYASYRDYRDAVYLHGQEFLQALRERVGDEDFFAFLKDYIARYSGQIATRQDFFSLLASHTSVGIDDLVKEYFGK